MRTPTHPQRVLLLLELQKGALFTEKILLPHPKVPTGKALCRPCPFQQVLQKEEHYTERNFPPLLGRETPHTRGVPIGMIPHLSLMVSMKIQYPLLQSEDTGSIRFLHRLSQEATERGLYPHPLW